MQQRDGPPFICQASVRNVPGSAITPALWVSKIASERNKGFPQEVPSCLWETGFAAWPCFTRWRLHGLPRSHSEAAHFVSDCICFSDFFFLFEVSVEWFMSGLIGYLREKCKLAVAVAKGALGSS